MAGIKQDSTWNFWLKVDRRSVDECWNWKGALSPKGYGCILFNSVMKRAHRVSWEIHNGPIPKGRLVLHRCDNRSCMNPAHLYLGTHGDNNYDRAIRNPSGQGGLTSRFYSGEIRLMRRLHNSGTLSQGYISKVFKCNQATISRLLRKENL